MRGLPLCRVFPLSSRVDLTCYGEGPEKLKGSSYERREEGSDRRIKGITTV